MIECDICHRVFKNARAVEMHKARTHSGDPRWAGNPDKRVTAGPNVPIAPTTPSLVPQPCLICGRPITASRMRNHLRKVHGATAYGEHPPLARSGQRVANLPDVTEVEAVGRVVDRTGQISDTDWQMMASRTAQPHPISVGLAKEPFEPDVDEPVEGELALNWEKLRVIGEDGDKLIVKFGDEYAELTIRWLR